MGFADRSRGFGVGWAQGLGLQAYVRVGPRLWVGISVPGDPATKQANLWSLGSGLFGAQVFTWLGLKLGFGLESSNRLHYTDPL